MLICTDHDCEAHLVLWMASPAGVANVILLTDLLSLYAQSRGRLGPVILQEILNLICVLSDSGCVVGSEMQDGTSASSELLI